MFHRFTPPRSFAWAAAAAVLCGSVATTECLGISFSEVTDPANPIVTDENHVGGKYFGATWIDYDGDGDPDLATNLGQLYRNDGGGAFTRIDGSGLGDDQTAGAGFSMSGLTWGDYDSDGDPDCFIAGETSNLYRNEGDGTFTTVTEETIGDPFDNRGWAATWGDINNDGHLDLVVIHPAGFIPGGSIPNRLFLGDGAPDFTFTEVLTGPIVEGLDSYTVGSWSDHDHDGDLDLFIGSGPANGTQQPDNVYRNLLVETGTADFERIAESPLGTEGQDGQLWNWIDYDNDGDLDAFVTNYSGGVAGGLNNRLYRQESDGSFTSITDQSLSTDGGVSLGSLWEDFDNDGDLDCYVGNDGGGVDFLYENNGDGTFTPVAGTPVTAIGRPSRGGGCADYDDDGDMDLFVNGPTTSRVLFENTNDNGNGFLHLRLIGTTSNTSAIGAKVRVKATIFGNEVWQMREISSQNSFQGHSEFRAHFGLGDAAFADSVVVEWPSGAISVGLDFPEGVSVNITEGAVADVGDPGGDSAGSAANSRGSFGLIASPHPIANDTEITFTLPETSSTRLEVFDLSGRRVDTLFAGTLEAGSQSLIWSPRGSDGNTLAGGTYILRLQSGDRTESRRLIVMQ